MKSKINLWFFIGITLLIVWSIVLPDSVEASPQLPQQSITSPSQLIDAVNNLRLSYGLQPLTVHPVLMQSSQSQADYMAATGQVTHARPGGISFTQQLLTLGFPLAGDLSLGGFRAENILSSGGPLVWNGVPSGWQDADHMNTMLSQNFTHIGAGISQGPGWILLCTGLCRRDWFWSNANECVRFSQVCPLQKAEIRWVSVNIWFPWLLSTARPDGDVFHKVQYGQTLWSIAIEYGTTIKNIQALNYLGEDLVVYQGQELLVKKAATQPAPATPTSSAFHIHADGYSLMLSHLRLSFPTSLVAIPNNNSSRS